MKCQVLLPYSYWYLCWYHWCWQVLRPPRYGTLHSSSSQKHHRLQSGDTFTQQDLDAARLRYRLHRKAYSHVHDDITFRVSAPECASMSGTLGLLHVPSGQTRDEVRATLERLQVGGNSGTLQPLLRLPPILRFYSPTFAASSQPWFIARESNQS
jgi:hypothetical protein